MNKPYTALLRLLKPGVWYCSIQYDGCRVLEQGAPVRGKIFEKLIGEGYVECEPVFDGFSTKKYRITDMGTAWLATQPVEMPLDPTLSDVQ